MMDTLNDKVMKMTVLCPRCQNHRYTPYGVTKKMLMEEEPVLTENQVSYWFADFPFPALSRLDNKTYICSPCGQDEAMRDFGGEPPIPPNEWPI